MRAEWFDEWHDRGVGFFIHAGPHANVPGPLREEFANRDNDSLSRRTGGEYVQWDFRKGFGVDLPVGTVLIKNFTHAGRRIETPLFVRHADAEWAGYTYSWNVAQTDAVPL